MKKKPTSENGFIADVLGGGLDLGGGCVLEGGCAFVWVCRRGRVRKGIRGDSFVGSVE